MILWCDGDHDPAENMLRDRALLDRLERGDEREPVLRLFRFAPHGITLGASQAPERVLDLERCRREHVPWAVRPTGGRAIFHAEEWTYSLSARIDDSEWGGTLREAYARTARLLIASLLRLGVPVEAAPGASAGRGVARATASAACFASTGGHELVLAGRKLAGSAQRRLTHAFLQQGSVLLGSGHLRLIDYLAVADARRAQMQSDLRRRTADAGRWLGDASLERWADALASVLTKDGRQPPRRVSAAAGIVALTPRETASRARGLPTPPDAARRSAP